MIGKAAIRWRWFRRKFNRTRWAARLMGLPLPAGETDEPGLIMIQIDGLSRKQFERAMERGRLPYLEKLLATRHFTKESFYSGVPSTTPAVQGELFYGVKSAVPAFQFFRRKEGKSYVMFDAECADTIEAELKATGANPLLEGAHVYSNIYRAGAAESHYCSADFAVDRIVNRMHPLKRLILSIAYLPKIIRATTLALIELLLAIVDCFKRNFDKAEFIRELKFIPARVGVCIVGREAIRFQILLDIERGVRVIHANFLGYDEQAHRRGPGSAFAHWSLKGIDAAIRDIHRASQGSAFRDYELVVYSDHGQQRVTPYETLHGKSVHTAVAEVFSKGPAAGRGYWHSSKPVRARGRQLLHQRPGNGGLGTVEECAEKIVVAAMGPIGHLYLPLTLQEGEREGYAKELVAAGKIPLVLLGGGIEGRTRAYNARGEWLLPRDGAEIVGGDHPFFEDVVADLTRLCHHPDAGDFIISGWDPQAVPLTFAPENGAHGGPGFEETHGFVLVPDRIFRWHRTHHASSGKWMRATDLREVVLHFLGSDGAREERTFTKPGEVAADFKLRVMTYNIHSCAGTDGKVRPERIARVINHFDPDVVAVQEVDAHRPRTRGHDQAQLIADHLRMSHAFYAVFEEAAQKYGIAIFSRHPFKLVKMELLTPPGPGWREARGAMWVTLDLGPDRPPVHVINTHFGLGRDEKRRQAEELLGSAWLGGIGPDEPVILCGDFNSIPRSVVWKLLKTRLRDVQLGLKGHRPGATFTSFRPIVRIDHVFVSHHFKVGRIELPRTATARVASDHLPLCAELSMSKDHDGV